MTTIPSITSVTPVPSICNIPLARVMHLPSLLHIQQAFPDGSNGQPQQFGDLFGSQGLACRFQDLDHFSACL
jgi:hypothetical protein